MYGEMQLCSQPGYRDALEACKSYFCQPNHPAPDAYNPPEGYSSSYFTETTETNDIVVSRLSEVCGATLSSQISRQYG
jgi:hypothetical protein